MNNDNSQPPSSFMSTYTNEFTKDFKESFKKIKEKKLKLAQISRFLSPSQPKPPAGTDSTLSKSTTSDNDSSPAVSLHKSSESKYFSKEKQPSSPPSNKSNESEQASAATNNDFNFKPSKKFNTKNKDKDKDKDKETSNEINEESNGENAKAGKIDESIMKDAIPNCPICAKVLHSWSQRQSHMKKCAQLFRIRTESLVELVKKQQERIDRDVKKGLVPTEVYIPKFKKKPTANAKTKSKRKSNPVDSNQTLLTENFGVNVTSKNDKKAKPRGNQCALIKLDDAEKRQIVTSRFEKILKNVRRNQQVECANHSLVTSKFDTANNYLWDLCKYFQESADCFYVKSFLDDGKLLVGNRVFIDKIDEKRYSNVTVINTQTAYLLADLNDTSQLENLSIYYTQLSKSNQSQFLANMSIREEMNKTQSTSNLSFVKINVTNDVVDLSATINPAPELNAQSQIPSSARDLFVNDDSSLLQVSNAKLPNTSQEIMSTSYNDDDGDGGDESMKKNQIFIDETKLDENISDESTSVKEEEEQDDELSAESSNNSNIFEKNLDLIDESNSTESVEFTSKRNAISTTIVILEDDSNSKPADEAKNCQSLSKKRKSIDIIELEDSSNSGSNGEIECLPEESSKKFRPDSSLNHSNNLNESSSNPNVDDYKQNKTSCEMTFSILPDLNISTRLKTTPNQDKTEHLDEEQILELLNQTEQPKQTQVKVNKDNQTENRPSIIDNEPENHDLDEVWKNFGEDHFDVQYDIDCNNDIIMDQNNQTIKNPVSSQSSNPIVGVSTQTNKNQSPICMQNESKTDVSMNHDDNDDDDFQVDEFLKNYREKNMKKPVTTETNTKDTEEIVADEAADSESNSPDQITTAKTPLNNRIRSNLIAHEQQGVNLTPMPNYVSMNTPNLKVELKKYGLKALPRRQAVLKLTEIYEYTHRNKLKSMPRSQSCMNLKVTTANLPKATVANRAQADDERTTRTNDSQPGCSRFKKTISDLNLNTHLIGKNQFNSDTQPDLLKIGVRRGVKKKAKETVNLQEQTLDHMMLEMIEKEDDNEESSKKITKINKTLDDDETRKYVYNLIREDANLYLSILNYEPVDYEKLFNEIQVNLAPRKVNNKSLMKVLDEYCITFTLKSLNTRTYGSKVKSKKKH